MHHVKMSECWKLSLLFFLLTKIIYVVLPVFPLSEPRMGDDSYVHLWKGRSVVTERKPNAPALINIARLQNLSDEPSEQTRFLRDRVGMRALGVISPFSAALQGIPLALGLSPRWSFALTEVLTALCFTGGLAAFLFCLWGRSAMCFALIIGAFSIGMNMISAIQCLGLSLFLWSLVLRGRRAGPALLVAFLCVVIHPFAQFYLAIALALAVWKRRPVLFCVGLGLLIILTSKAYLLSFGIPLTPSAGTGRIGLSEFAYNWGAVGGILREMWIDSPAVIITGALGVMIHFRRIFTRDTWAFLFLVGGALIASFFYSLPGYPGNIFARVAYLLLFVLLGAAGTFIAGLWESPLRHRRVMAGVLCVVLCFSSLPRWGRQIFQTIRGGREVILEKNLRHQIDSLRLDHRVLFIESDVALMASLLEGASKLNLYPYPMLRNSPSETLIYSEIRPDILVFLANTDLNTLSRIGVKTFEKRRRGFHLRYTDHLEISGLDRSVFFFVQSESGAKIQLKVSRPPCAANTLEWQVPANFAGWKELMVEDCPDSSFVKIEFAPTEAWITGLSSRAHGPERLRWPWGEKVALRAHFRKGDPSLDFDFSWDSVFRQAGAQTLLTLPGAFRAISDDSGLLFVARDAH